MSDKASLHDAIEIFQRAGDGQQATMVAGIDGQKQSPRKPQADALCHHCRIGSLVLHQGKRARSFPQPWVWWGWTDAERARLECRDHLNAPVRKMGWAGRLGRTNWSMALWPSRNWRAGSHSSSWVRPIRSRE